MSIHVLLADDHQLVRQGIRALLEREHFHVTAEASDGQEAVRQAERTTPDVAVLDLSMPTLNGIDAGRAYLFDGLTGNLLLDIASAEPRQFGAFGWLVAALNDNRLVVGDFVGSVYVFEAVPEPSTLGFCIVLIVSLLVAAYPGGWKPPLHMREMRSSAFVSAMRLGCIRVSDRF